MTLTTSFHDQAEERDAAKEEEEEEEDDDDDDVSTEDVDRQGSQLNKRLPDVFCFLDAWLVCSSSDWRSFACSDVDVR